MKKCVSTLTQIRVLFLCLKIDNPPETPKKKAVLIFYMSYHVSIQLCGQFWRGIVANSCLCCVK